MSPFQRSAQRRRIETIIRHSPVRTGSKILDVGTGSGWLASKLSGKSCRPVAMDLGLFGLRNTARRYPDLDLVAGDVYQLPFGPRTFDGAVLSEVLEHLAHPERALKGLRVILKDEGWLLICVPYREKIRQTLCIHCNRLTPVDAHLHSFDEGSVRRLAESAGFVPVRTLRFMDSGLERFGFARLSSPFPYLVWGVIDLLMVRLRDQPSYLLALFRRGL